jgi:hypothetical protein
MKKSKQKPKNSAQAHPDLKGFNVWINPLGEIESTHSVDEINIFLNQKVVDKKLKDRFGYKSAEDDDTVDFMYGKGE